MCVVLMCWGGVVLDVVGVVELWEVFGVFGFERGDVGVLLYR